MYQQEPFRRQSARPHGLRSCPRPPSSAAPAQVTAAGPSRWCTPTCASPRCDARPTLRSEASGSTARPPARCERPIGHFDRSTPPDRCATSRNVTPSTRSPTAAMIRIGGTITRRPVDDAASCGATTESRADVELDDDHRMTRRRRRSTIPPTPGPRTPRPTARTGRRTSRRARVAVQRLHRRLVDLHPAVQMGLIVPRPAVTYTYCPGQGPFEVVGPTTALRCVGRNFTFPNASGSDRFAAGQNHAIWRTRRGRRHQGHCGLLGRRPGRIGVGSGPDDSSVCTAGCTRTDHPRRGRNRERRGRRRREQLSAAHGVTSSGPRARSTAASRSQAINPPAELTARRAGIGR